jgi:O-antigen/teichoic acid export membrane protein
VIRLPRDRRHRITGTRLQVVAAEYRDFPLFNAPANLLSEVSLKLPILVMGPWLGMDVVGFYAMASRLVGMPLRMAGGAFRVVMLQKVSEAYGRGGNLQVLYLKALAGLIATAIIPFGLLWAFGAEMLAIILGDNWVEAGRYVQLLAPWYFAVWVSALVPPFLTALRRQGIWLVIQIMVLVGRAGAFAYGYWIDASIDFVLQVFVWTNVALATIMVLVGFVEARKTVMIRA